MERSQWRRERFSCFVNQPPLPIWQVMKKRKILNYLIAGVWIANGLFCKVLNLVPRHQEIVARILGTAHAEVFTRAIGFAEIAMAVWILSGFKSKLNAITQVLVIGTMNSVEFIMAPDLLLWGRFNALFAFLFILVILYSEFYLSLKNHPFAVEAFFESSLVFTFAVPKGQVQHLIPECLELDTFDDKWAFIAVAMVQTKSLRPKGFPKMLGNDFFLIGYRLFVRYTSQAGKNLRGLYILRSETDKKKMEFLGNIFTHYNYTTTDIHQIRQNGTTEISSKKSGFKIRIDNSGNENVSLPAGSPFADWKEARRFAGPLPFTFTCNAVDKEVLIIEGVRENWKPTPVKVIDQNFSFIDGMKLNDVRLANTFIIHDIPYFWKKGKIEQWK
jgi:uncharacterized protein YqjF (DUF2071 family)